MSESILNSIKASLGLVADDASFDPEIIMHLNTTFASLQELGLGPENGFEVETKNEVWADFYAEERRLNHIRSYVYMRVRMLFDPPQTAHAISAFEKQIEKLEWHITTTQEELSRNFVSPPPP